VESTSAVGFEPTKTESNWLVISRSKPLCYADFSTPYSLGCGFKLLCEQMALIINRQIIPFKHIVLGARAHPHTRRPIFRNPFVLCPAVWIARRHGLDPLIIRYPCGNAFKAKSAFTALRNGYPWNHQDFTEKFVPALITCNCHAIYTLVRHTSTVYNDGFRY